MIKPTDDTMPLGAWLAFKFYDNDGMSRFLHGVINPSAIWLCREATTAECKDVRPAVYVVLTSGVANVMTGDAADVLMKYFKIKEYFKNKGE